MGRRGRIRDNSGPAIEEEDFEDGFADPDVEGLNDPDTTHLPEPPLIGGRTRNAEVFGDQAETQGRMTSPKLHSSATRFPAAVQFRVWRLENGVPVAIGSISADADEDDFIEQFFEAMPKKGEGRFHFKLRPIDVRGNELGQETSQIISESHITLQRIRARRAAEKEEDMPNSRWGRGGDVIVNGGAGQDPGASIMAEEMGRMFEHAVETAEERTRMLQETLEQERDRLRQEEKQRLEERIGLADRSAGVVKDMTERLMASDRARADEAIKSQATQSGVMLNTLTTVFQQQQEAQRLSAERQREIDAQKAAQDREFFERQRAQVEEQRRHDLMEAERKRQEEIDRRKFEMEELRLKVERDREQAKLEMEERRREDERRFEQRRMDEDKKREEERREWERRETARREEERRYDERRREELIREEARRKEEVQLQLAQLSMSAQKDREHAERMMEIARMERETAREAQERREKMEREAREQADRDRQRQYDMEMRRLEQQAQADREHAERMIQLQKSQNSGGLSGLTDMLGMETPELLARIFGAAGDGEGGSSWSDAIPKTLGALADAWKVAMTAQAQQQRQLPQQPRPQITTNPHLDRLMREGTGPIVQTQVSPAPAPRPFVPSTDLEEDEVEAPAVTAPKPKPLNLIKLATDAGIKVWDQRKARKALKDLILALRDKTEDEYFGTVVEAMTKEPTIGAYIKAVSLEAALREAGATEEEITRSIDTLRASEMVPSDIPLSQADLTEGRAKPSQEATKIDTTKGEKVPAALGGAAEAPAASVDAPEPDKDASTAPTGAGEES